MSTHGGHPDSEPVAPETEPTAEPTGPDTSTDEAPEVETLPAPSPLELELQAVRAELAEAQRKHEEAMARLRTVSKAFSDQQAEQAAFRERMEARSKQDAEKRGTELTERFFEPVQNLRRSLDAAGDREDPLLHGLKMVLHQFMEVMHQLGLREVPGVGAQFDPLLHEALALMPVDDPAADGRILHVHAVGYTVKGKTLQPAQVVIGKYDAPAAEVAAEEAAAQAAPEEPAVEALPDVEPGEA